MNKKESFEMAMTVMKTAAAASSRCSMFSRDGGTEERFRERKRAYRIAARTGNDL